MNKLPQKIIIDTDPGKDDAAAIMLAFGNPALIDVIGITTVFGNVPVTQTTINALKICELAGRPDVPVFAGAERPLFGEPRHARFAHGATGLDGPNLPEPKGAARAQNATDYIVETLLTEPEGSVTLCCLGPLTNIAQALRKSPKALQRLDRIILMGGGFFAGGNVSPTAEFNILADPEAAHAVLRAGLDVTIVPLDVTHSVIVTPERFVRLEAAKTPQASAVAAMMAVSNPYYASKFGFAGSPVHDALVIAYLLRPDLFNGRECNVEISLSQGLTRGMTVVDWWRCTDRQNNATFLNGCDANGVFELVLAGLSANPRLL